jgi:hypothetical protein
MKSRKLWKSAFVVIATFSLLLPNSILSVANAGRSGKSNHSSKSSSRNGQNNAAAVQDVSLNADGSFTASIVDGQGKPVAGIRVVVRNGRAVIAEARTDDAGQFHVERLRGGVYEISHSQGKAVSRVWSEGTAPKSVRQNGRLVTHKSQSRDQDDRDLLSRIDSNRHHGNHPKPKKPKKPKKPCKPGHTHGRCDRPDATQN